MASNDNGAYAADTPAAPGKTPPAVRRLGLGDLAESLREGMRNFLRAPLIGLFVGAAYAAGGWLIVAVVFRFYAPYLAYPLAIGFALVAPFACAGVYEVSRRLERGEAPAWPGVWRAVWGFAGAQLGWLSLVSLFALILWVDYAWMLFLMFYGLHVPTPRQLLVDILTTPTGAVFFVVGNAVGALIAFVVFSITVVSPTLLVDRDLDFVTAMLTSVRLVIANPLVMLVWAATIGFALALSIATGFLGLVIVLPVLGHASWALYRRAVALS
jgi:uncharacterized membrane protein